MIAVQLDKNALFLWNLKAFKSVAAEILFSIIMFGSPKTGN
jgi:hypothetical protein